MIEEWEELATSYVHGPAGTTPWHLRRVGDSFYEFGTDDQLLYGPGVGQSGTAEDVHGHLRRWIDLDTANLAQHKKWFGESAGEGLRHMLEMERLFLKALEGA